MGKTDGGKNPPLLAVALECLAALDWKDPPLHRLRLLLKSACRRRPQSSTEINPAPIVSLSILLPRRRRLEVSRLSNYRPVIVAACPFGPSLQGSSTNPMMLVAASSAATGKWSFPCMATFFCSVPRRECGSPCRRLPVGPSRRLGRRVGVVPVHCDAAPRSARVEKMK
jgi:hypothetical protein